MINCRPAVIGLWQEDYLTEHNQHIEDLHIVLELDPARQVLAGLLA